VTSTSLCIARNTPKIMVDLRTYKEDIREQSLQAFHHRAEAGWRDARSRRRAAWARLLAAAAGRSSCSSAATASRPSGDGWMVAAKAGAPNKLGYIAAHSAIVLVCLGGLFDGDLIVRAQMLLQRQERLFTGGGMIADVPPQHRLPPSNPTFRGNMLVAEGTQSARAILNQADGILLQDLPFSIELKKFIVDYYSTGMPKLFASEIVIHDRETGEAVPGARRGEPPGQLPRRRDLPVELRRRRLQVKLAAVPMAARPSPSRSTA
jgi:cytochrome c biogenesis protein